MMCARFCKHVGCVLSRSRYVRMGPGRQVVPQSHCRPSIWKVPPATLISLPASWKACCLSSVDWYIAGQCLTAACSFLLLVKKLAEAKQNSGGRFSLADHCLPVCPLLFFSVFQFIDNIIMI